MVSKPSELSLSKVAGVFLEQTDHIFLGDFALQEGTYNLTVDTRERILVTEVGNNASIDTWTWNRNVTFSLEVVGYSLSSYTTNIGFAVAALFCDSISFFI